MTDGPTDGPTTRLLELLRAAKKLDFGISKNYPVFIHLLIKVPVPVHKQVLFLFVASTKK